MTTPRDVIAQWAMSGTEVRIDSLTDGGYAFADAVLAALLSASDSVRQELAALLSPCRSINPWRAIEGVPPELKDGRPVLALIPCYGHYNEIGKLRGYLHAIVTWKYGQWNEVGVGKREPAHFQELLPAPPSEDKT